MVVVSYLINALYKSGFVSNLSNGGVATRGGLSVGFVGNGLDRDICSSVYNCLTGTVLA